MEWIACGIVAVWEVGLGYWIFVQSFPERRSYSVAARGAEIVCLAVVCMLYTWNSTMCFVSNLACIFQGVMCAVYLWIYYKCKIGVAVSWELFYWIFMSLIRVPFLVWEGMGKTLHEVNSRNKTVAEFMYEIVLLIAISILYIRYSRTQKKQIGKHLDKYKVFYFILAAIMWEVMSLTMQAGMDGFQGDALLIFMLSYVGMLCIIFFFIVYLILRYIKKEKELLIQQQNTLRRQQLEEKELFDRYERNLHDVKHIFLFIRQCLEEEEYEKALYSVKEAQKKVYSKKVWTGYQEIDFVLNSKQEEIQTLGIDVILEAEICSIPMESLDFSIVLGNLLDNAVEAVQQCKEGERKICLELKSMNDIFQMVIWNSSIQMPIVEKGVFKTTKEDIRLHGWGIKNVCLIVGKYNGEIGFQYDEKSFEVKIILNGGDVL